MIKRVMDGVLDWADFTDDDDDDRKGHFRPYLIGTPSTHTYFISLIS